MNLKKTHRLHIMKLEDILYLCVQEFAITLAYLLFISIDEHKSNIECRKFEVEMHWWIQSI